MRLQNKNQYPISNTNSPAPPVSPPKKVDFRRRCYFKSHTKMSSPIVQPSAFSASKVSISQPKVLESGGKLAYLNYGDARSLMMQTPSLPSPFGMNVFDKNGPPKYSLDLAMRGYNGTNANPKVKAFYEALTALDEFMIDQGVKNSKLWFKADMKREVVQAFYTPCVKFGRDKEGNQTPYPPNVKLQLRRRRDRDEFETDFYDEKSKTDPHAKPLKGIPIEEMLVKKVEVTALMQCTGVWFAGGKFGLSWKAVQIRLDSVPAGLGRGPAFQEEEDGGFAEPAEFAARAPRAPAVQDEDDEEEETAHASAPVPVATTSTKQQQVVEDDDEEEVAPAPVPKKKVVTTKKVVAGGK
jgi:hypothetical protein